MPYIKELMSGIRIFLIQYVSPTLIMLPYYKMNNKSPPAQAKQKELLPLPDQVVEFFAARIEIEQEYARALLRLNNRLDNIENNSTTCGNVLMSLKSIHSERVHQIGGFVQQLRRQKQVFVDSVNKFHKEVQKSTSQVRSSQRNLKIVLQKISKLHARGESQIKEADQKFILKQLTFMGQNYRKKNVEQSLKVLEQQKITEEKMRQEYETLKQQGQKLIKKVKKHQKIIHQQSPQIQFQIIQFVKKYTIQQISLIRNLQYDLDNMIKKTKIFDQKEPVEQVKTTKTAVHPTVKQAKDLFKKQFNIFDPYFEIKGVMANRTVIQKSKQTQKQDKSEKIEQILENSQQFSKMTQSIGSANNQERVRAIRLIQSLRHQNKNKFEKKDFQKIVSLFKLLMKASFDAKDLQGIHRLIIYGSIYICQQNKECVMDRVRKEEYLSDIYFWKFLVYFAIYGAVSDCLGIQNEKDMHVQNNVFSALVSNSLNMIGTGIDKYQVRNTVAKMSKAFGLGEGQLSDLLKFIDNGYEKYEKFKK